MALTFDKDATAHPVHGGCVSASYLVIGIIDNNTYLIEDGKGGVIVVDPSAHPDAIMDAVGERRVSALFVTHAHFDHVGALNALRTSTKAPVYASRIDAPAIENPHAGDMGISSEPCHVDHLLDDGDVIRVGATKWTALLTPGHTKGGMCYYIAPEDGTYPQGDPMLVSGDTLFYGSIGRVDFEGGSIEDMRASLRKLEKLPGNTIVMPGHNVLTTIDAERTRVFDAYR